MNCAICMTNKIDPKTAPYGGFLCCNEHMQCYECNSKNYGRCRICKQVTTFVYMTLNPVRESLAATQARIAHSAVEKPPTAPLLSNANLLPVSVDKQSSCVMAKSMFDDIEAQSNISQEHLSMHESQESGSVAENSIRIMNENSLTKNIHSMVHEQLPKVKEKTKMPEEVVYIRNREQNASLYCGVRQPSAADNLRLSVSNPPRNQSNETPVGGGGASNVNVFIVQNEPEDHNVIHTSEIRFMDSSESLNNLLAGESPLQAAHSTNRAHDNPPSTHRYVVTTESGVLLEPLSTKTLRDFDNQNTAHSVEVVESYLKSYSPLAYYRFPNYNCPHQHQMCDGQQNPPQMKSISVSTDSDPSLKSLKPETTSAEAKYNLPANINTQNYVVMHSAGVSGPQADNILGLDKFGRPNLDMQMQKILETFQEDPRQRKLTEKPDPAKGNVMKLLTPGMVSTDLVAQRRHLQQDIPRVSRAMASEEYGGVAILHLVNSYHALYHPTDGWEPPVCNIHRQCHPQPASREPPPPQYHHVHCLPALIQDLLSVKAQFMDKRPVPAGMLNIPRQPIQCPESTCQRMIFVSDFNKHFELDHIHLPMERISPFQCKNFFLDPRLTHCRTSKCHLMYLLRDKILDLGNSKYKDFLPVLVMTSRLSLLQMCRVQQDMEQTSVEFLIIWITGLVPEELPMSVSLTVWPRSGPSPSCHLVYSGDMYSVRQSQQALDVWKSGRMLMLSVQELELLTNGGKDMLNMQLVVH